MNSPASCSRRTRDPPSATTRSTRIEVLEQEALTLKRRARRSDFTKVERPLREAARALGITLPETIPNDLGQRAVDLVREMNDIEAKALDGEDARATAAPVVARFTTSPVDAFLSSRPVLLSECWERALKFCRTVANVLSIGFDVRMCFQCSVG